MSAESQNIVNELAQMLDSRNNYIHSWTLTTKALFKQSITSLNLVDQKELLNSIKHRLKKDTGEISSVGFAFEPYGVYVHKGVGKGREIGSSSASKNKQEWFNPIIEKRVDSLFEFVADYNAEKTLTEVQRILIS